MKEIIFYTDDVDESNKLVDDESNFINTVANKYLKKEIVITPMFTVPLLHIKMSNWEFKKPILLDLFKKSEEWISKRDTVNTTYLNDTDFKEKSKEQILKINSWDEYLSKILFDVFYEELKIIYETFGDPENYPNKIANISYAWFQEQKDGMFHFPHSHGNCGLSAVCFVEYDEKYHTPTHFLSPYLNPLKGHNEEYCEQNISSGSLLVFPSNIIHHTYPNNSEKNRIILAFNASI